MYRVSLLENPSISIEELHVKSASAFDHVKGILTVGTAPEIAKTPIAAVITPQPNRSFNAVAAMGPQSVATAIEQLKRA